MLVAPKKSTKGSRNWERHLVYVVSVPGLVVGSLLYRLWSPLGHPLQLSCMPVLAGSFGTGTYMKIKGQKRFLPPSNSPWPLLSGTDHCTFHVRESTFITVCLSHQKFKCFCRTKCFDAFSVRQTKTNGCANKICGYLASKQNNSQ